MHSIDYLLKPVTTARLKKTMHRLTEQFSQHQSTAIQEVTNSFVVECFKEFQLFHNSKLVPFKTSKVKELLAFFLIHQNTPVHRDVLIESLWPDQDYKKSKINLHTSISHLRKLLTSFGYNEAIKVYIDYQNQLQTDLGVTPSDKLVELYNHLKLYSI